MPSNADAPGAAPAEDDYFLEIESHFASRRRTPFVFSAKDWAMMKSWREEGIPLPVVLEAIDSCFEKREAAGRKRTISSLAYCRHAVRELWDERKDLQIGAGGSVPEADSGSALDQLISEMEACAANTAIDDLRAPLQAATRAMREMKRSRPIRELEEELVSIEGRMIGQLESALPEGERAALEGEVDRELSAHRFSDEAVARRTREANRRRLLRRRLGLPRLSLFG